MAGAKKKKTEADLEAEAKVKAYEEELKRKKLLNRVYMAVTGIVTIVLIMVFSGDRFSGVLAVVGLRSAYNEEGGIYADCSKSENRNNPYCSKKESASERSWKVLTRGGGRAPQFSLSGN